MRTQHGDERAWAVAPVTPDQVTIAAGWTRLTTALRGEIAGDGHGGLYAANTRLLDRLRYALDGRPPEHTLSGCVAHDQWFGTFRAEGSTEEGDLAPGTVPRGALELRIGRLVDGGVREVWWLDNHDARARTVTVELSLRAWVADEVELELARTADVAPARVYTEAEALRLVRAFGPRAHTAPELAAEYPAGAAPRDGDPVERGLVVRVDPATLDPARTHVELRAEAGEEGAALVRVSALVPARGRWDLALLFEPLIDGLTLAAPAAWRSAERPPPRGPHIFVASAGVDAVIRQARRDLEALALPPFTDSGNSGPTTLAAGAPRYIAVFGRDSLTAAFQGALFCRDWLVPALERLARLQTRRRADDLGAEPGRLPHERRLGPAAAIGRLPELSYGDVVAPAFWVAALEGARGWLGEGAWLDRLLPVGQRAIDWVEHALARGGGLVWDDGRGPGRNHAWKDSGDGIVDGRGRVCAPPLALVEEQGYAYLALVGWGNLLAARGRLLRARHYFRLAAELKRRFNARFWLREQRYFALALDAHGTPVDAITSNPGHALGCGVIDEAHVPDVVARLLAPDLFSGWGVRTLSSHNPAYDPFSYHRGSVWPVENATIAASMALHGFPDEAARIIEGQLAAAMLFQDHRLPEVFGGQPRDDEHPLPGLYPRANPVQAWSASAVGLMLQTLLGLRALAPLRTLLVRPHLPEWLPQVILRDLQIGAARVDLRFWRTRSGRTRFRVLRRRGVLVVLEQPALTDKQAGLAERLFAAGRSLV